MDPKNEGVVMNPALGDVGDRRITSQVHIVRDFRDKTMDDRLKYILNKNNEITLRLITLNRSKF